LENEKFTESFGRGTPKKQTNQRKHANINFREFGFIQWFTVRCSSGLLWTWQ